NCKAMTSIDLSKFNTASVTTMESMFYGCSKLESLDLSNFTFKAETNYESMFAGTGSDVKTNTNELIPIYVKDEEDKTTLESAVGSLIYSQIIVKSNGL
ncbi:MAG: BspA family leucine-rich repeat surface protein, partial [Bacteroides sp.]|nr:BspA family leucine-rich repeat surface protein [Bacteroides sp.]